LGVHACAFDPTAALAAANPMLRTKLRLSINQTSSIHCDDQSLQQHDILRTAEGKTGLGTTDV
jgi:hypothetical protein